jgi:hypothetical protein
LHPSQNREEHLLCLIQGREQLMIQNDPKIKKQESYVQLETYKNPPQSLLRWVGREDKNTIIPEIGEDTIIPEIGKNPIIPVRGAEGQRTDYGPNIIKQHSHSWKRGGSHCFCNKEERFQYCTTRGYLSRYKERDKKV